MFVKILFMMGIGALITLLMFTLRKARLSKTKSLPILAMQKTSPISLVEDFSGDNPRETELDLAKAYLELQQYEKAKHLLKSVIIQGEPEQILAARKMFTQLLKEERLT